MESDNIRGLHILICKRRRFFCFRRFRVWFQEIGFKGGDNIFFNPAASLKICSVDPMKKKCSFRAWVDLNLTRYEILTAMEETRKKCSK